MKSVSSCHDTFRHHMLSDLLCAVIGLWFSNEPKPQEIATKLKANGRIAVHGQMLSPAWHYRTPPWGNKPAIVP